MESEGSLPRSQELSTCTYPEPNQFSPRHPIPSLKGRSSYYLSTYSFVFLVVPFPLAFLPVTYTLSCSPFALHGYTHLILLDLIILILLDEEYKLCSSSLCSFLHPPVTPSLFGPNIIHSTLFSNTVSLCSSLNARDYVSHPYRTRSKIIALYILILIFFDIRREDGRFRTEW
jgi:hypothetical protein